VEHEGAVSTLAQKITWPTDKKNSPLLQKLVHENNIIIGYKTAQENHLKIGDKVTILIPEPGSSKKIFLHKKSFIISGIFKIGLEEYDNNFAFIDLQYLNKLFDEQGVDQVTLRLKELETPAWYTLPTFKNLCSPSWWKTFFIQLPTHIINFFKNEDSEQAALKQIAQRFPQLSVNSWKDLYPALVSSLKLEKYVMFFILALITLVASMNMISLLFMQIQYKLRDIAIFKTMGLANTAVKNIFLWSGISITLLASLAGLGCAAGAGYLLEKYPFIQLPDVYYISYLPARIDSDIFLAVFCATMLLGFLATWIPAHRTKYINIAHVLRQE
jgi:lipoprotein-releasing system permease protein